MDNVVIQFALIAVAIISFLLTGVISIFNTWDKHRDTEEEANARESGSKRKLNLTGRWLLIVQSVALLCGIFALIGGIFSSANSSKRMSELIAKEDAQAEEIGRQSNLVNNLMGQTLTLTENAATANAELSKARQDLRTANEILMTTKETTQKTLNEMHQLRSENESLKDDYALLRKSVEKSGQNSDDVKKILSDQDKERARREEETRRAAVKADQVRKRRASQTYVASFRVPNAAGVSVTHEGPQQKNSFIYILVPAGIIKLQCEVTHGVQWAAGQTGKDFSLTFIDNASRQTIDGTRVTVIGGVLKFNGKPMKLIDIPFPQEDDPFFEITY